MSIPDSHTADDKAGELAAYLAERDRVLRELDIAGAKRLAPQWHKPDDETVLLALHKTRYEVTTLPPELRHASRAWLAERGYSRMVGGPLLPEGELPQ